MKNQILKFWCFTVFIGMMFSACNKDEIIEEISIEENTLTQSENPEYLEVTEEMVIKFASYGYNANYIEKVNDGYIIEDDIKIDDWLFGKIMSSDVNQKQYTFRNIAEKSSYSVNITTPNGENRTFIRPIFYEIDNVSIKDNETKAVIINSFEEWNKLANGVSTGVRLWFYFLPISELDQPDECLDFVGRFLKDKLTKNGKLVPDMRIVKSSGRQSNATATAPSDLKRVGREITIWDNFYALGTVPPLSPALRAEYKKLVFMHEIGHTLGLAHTDYRTRNSCRRLNAQVSGDTFGIINPTFIHIPGTPQDGDDQNNDFSLMSACDPGGPEHIEFLGYFNDFDKKAMINRFYLPDGETKLLSYDWLNEGTSEIIIASADLEGVLLPQPDQDNCLREWIAQSGTQTDLLSNCYLVTAINEDQDNDGLFDNDDNDNDGYNNDKDEDDDNDTLLSCDEIDDGVRIAGLFPDDDVLDGFDTDNDGIFNIFDNDDDNDGIPTAYEEIDGDFNPRNDDHDNDGIPNYLDADDDNDGVLTALEDTNGDGNHHNDDHDNDGLPDYLDSDNNG
ncbi:M57 family metalloprotease [Aquimarina celericrescens]|uniref:M57 family metalloprotease n=1 Tax=Aquimarina celericrescens TaxID=1964542 RepID=A0ABW5AYV9_9FLAO|nr:hypothetical protein [Aquimarina celericrescens]